MCYPLAQQVNTMRDQPAARRGMFPGISGRLPTWRPSRSGNRCPERRHPCLFGRRDFCTICAPFLLHGMQCHELSSRRAPKPVAKSGQIWPKVAKSGHPRQIQRPVSANCSVSVTFVNSCSSQLGRLARTLKGSCTWCISRFHPCCFPARAQRGRQNTT
jgi:hypothetical protein